MKPKPLEEELGLDKEIIERMRNQKGDVLPWLVERFLVLRNWRVEIAPKGYEEFDYAPDAVYVAQLVRDLAVEVIKIKKKLGMIK